MSQGIGIIERIRLAWRTFTDAEFATRVAEGLHALEGKPPNAQSALILLSALQREGHFIDFLQRDAAGFSNEEIGAAARVVHRGCRKIMKQFFEIEPAVEGREGRQTTVPVGFDSDRIRLTGRVRGRPPFQGTLHHHGWFVRDSRIPGNPETGDLRVLAPAEIELPAALDDV